MSEDGGIGGGATAKAVPDPRAQEVRGRVRARFTTALDGNATVAGHLELVTWNWAVSACRRDEIPLYWAEPRFRYRYTTRALSLELNLKNPKNPVLKQRVLSGELGVKKLVNLTHQEMFPELWEQAYQKVAVRQLRREAPNAAIDAPDGAYTCGKCKSKKTVYTQVQIRSADEPMTIFCTCLQCGKNWKM